jgi:hypothetical protein
MAGSLVQSAVLPALHGSRAQYRRSAKTHAIARVTMSKLQVRSPSLRFSGNHVPRTFFLGSGSITVQAMRPVRKQGRRFVVKAMFERFTEKAIKVTALFCSKHHGKNYLANIFIICLLVEPLISAFDSLFVQVLSILNIAFNHKTIKVIIVVILCYD